jgi:hypothetical protein
MQSLAFFSKKTQKAAKINPRLLDFAFSSLDDVDLGGVFFQAFVVGIEVGNEVGEVG